jgi:ADP-heptose:LPS heptosyltransferase
VTARCLVVHPGSLGDVMLAGPALAHLRSLGFRTTLAVTSRLVPLFAGSRMVNEARDLETLALHRLFVEPLVPGALAPVQAFDAIVCWLGAGDAAFRTNLARVGCPMVIARAQPLPGAGTHVSRHLVDTLEPLGPVPSALPSARLHATQAVRASAAAWLAGRGIERGEAVVLQPGAGSPAKTWPGFASLARRLGDAGLPILALAGPADGPVVEALLASGAVTEDRLVRDWPLVEIAGLLSYARVTVGNDSGPTHLAAAVGCPTVAVFGPTDPLVWAPLGPGVTTVGGPMDGTRWPDVHRVESEVRAILAASPRVDAPPRPAGVR